MTTLEERKSIALARRDKLARRLGSTMLDSGKAPSELQTEIAATEHQIAAVDAAETEQVMRQREAAALAETERKADARKRLAQARDECLADVAQAQAGLEVLVESARRLIGRTAAMGQDMEIIGGRKTGTIDGPEFEKRLSGWISQGLAKITGHGQFLGYIKLYIMPSYGVKDWCEGEQREFDRAVSPFLEQAKD